MKNTRTKKEKQKLRENLFFGILIGALIIVLALAAVERFTKKDNVEVMITQDGHVHTMDGTHIGTVEEIFGEEAASLFSATAEPADAGETQNEQTTDAEIDAQ